MNKDKKEKTTPAEIAFALPQKPSANIIPLEEEKPPIGKIRRFAWGNKPHQTSATISLNGNRIGSAGNMTLIVAPPGTGKSAVCEAIIAASISGNSEHSDTFKITSVAQTLLYIDTERSYEDFWNSCARALRRAGKNDDTHGAILELWSMIENIDERAELLISRIQSQEYQLCVIDGIGDFVRSVNDEIGCNAFLNRLLAVAKQSGTTIATTIHDNPNSEKARGHLGSEAMRRAESVLRIEKRDAIRTLTTDFAFGKVRNSGDNLRSSFTWSPEKNMFISCDNIEKKINKRENTLRELAQSVFETHFSMRYTELEGRIQEITGKSAEMAKKRIREMSNANLIVKDDKERWILNGNEF